MKENSFSIQNSTKPKTLFRCDKKYLEDITVYIKDWWKSERDEGLNILLISEKKY